jgi:hypothetical protein
MREVIDVTVGEGRVVVTVESRDFEAHRRLCRAQAREDWPGVRYTIRRAVERALEAQEEDRE